MRRRTTTNERRLDGAHQGAEAAASPAPGAGSVSAAYDVRAEADAVEAAEAARSLFLELALAPELVEFLTLPAYTRLQ